MPLRSAGFSTLFLICSCVAAVGSENKAARAASVFEEPSFDLLRAVSLRERKRGSARIYFEPNSGGSPEEVKFLARGRGQDIFLTPEQAVLVLSRPWADGSPDIGQAVLRLIFAGSNKQSALSGVGQEQGTTNYFIGPPDQWRTGVPHYRGVRYKAIYPNVDVLFYGASGSMLEFDFEAAPGADISQLILRFEGADSLTIDESGNLVLSGDRWEVTVPKPVAYQEEKGRPVELPAAFVLLSAKEARIRVDGRDPRKPLLIDPQIIYSTYLGGSAYDSARSMAVDENGAAYVLSLVRSSDFPLAGALSSGLKGQDLAVTKLSPADSSMIFSTFIGGSGVEDPGKIDINAGRISIVATTDSGDFPTVNALYSQLNGASDAVLTELSPTGDKMLFSTYIGGSGAEKGLAVSANALGEVAVAGETLSKDFPTTSDAFQENMTAVVGAFVIKLDASRTRVFSTYVSGARSTTPTSIKMDEHGSVYAAGQVWDTGFPTTSGVIREFNSNWSSDGFLIKFDDKGKRIYSTLYGASKADSISDLDVDGSGNVVITGFTQSSDLPTVAAVQSKLGGAQDAFVAKLSQAADQLIFSTYLGGDAGPLNIDEHTPGIALDRDGSVYVAGFTAAADFPLKNPVQDKMKAWSDAVVVKLTKQGTLAFSTFLGGTLAEFAWDVAVGRDAKIYVCGETGSKDFPVKRPYQESIGGHVDGFVTVYGETFIFLR